MWLELVTSIGKEAENGRHNPQKQKSNEEIKPIKFIKRMHKNEELKWLNCRGGELMKQKMHWRIFMFFGQKISSWLWLEKGSEVKRDKKVSPNNNPENRKNEKRNEGKVAATKWWIPLGQQKGQ
jgi:hypothetical protein